MNWRCRRSVSILLFILLLSTFACQSSSNFQGEILDMTYSYDESTIYWPNAESFKLSKGDWGVTEAGYWYASNSYSAAEHGGTHADAPIHFAEGGRTIDQIPLEEWIGPAVKIDVTDQCTKNRDYRLQVSDIEFWISENGSIPKGAWVIMYTGIGTQFYPDKEKVLGTAKQGMEAIPELSFPGFSVEAVQFLLDSASITGIALDTPSIDYGKSTEFEVHQVLFKAGKLALENIANLDKLPTTGATLFVMPMLIREGTGAPARVFALLP